MTAVKTKSVWTKENSAVYTVSVGLREGNGPLSLTAAVLRAELNMSVCDADKVISSGVGHEPLLFHRITFHRGKRHRRRKRKKQIFGRYPVSRFKASTHTCSCGSKLCSREQSECAGAVWISITSRDGVR